LVKYEFEEIKAALEFDRTGMLDSGHDIILRCLHLL